MAPLPASESKAASKVGVVRFALTGAIASGVFFLLCWVGMFLPFGAASHMYIQLFTQAEITSGLALAQGLCWSVIFGAVAGLLISVTYNALSVFDAR